MTAFSVEYRALRASLTRSGVVLELPELHGGICGVMCAGGTAAARHWLRECLAGSGQDRSQAEIRAWLENLERATWRMLAGSQMAFEPLLPDDDADLDEQVDALASWCRGFLAGLAFGGLTLHEARGADAGDIAEIVEDFVEISRAALTRDDSAEEDRAGFALAELKEYVRTSVQIVFEALCERPAGADLRNVH